MSLNPRLPIIGGPSRNLTVLAKVHLTRWEKSDF